MIIKLINGVVLVKCNGTVCSDSLYSKRHEYDTGIVNECLRIKGWKVTGNRHWCPDCRSRTMPRMR